MIVALAAGLVGWLLLLSGAGKLTLWAEFRKAFADTAPLPPAVAAAAGWAAPPVECACGLAVLTAPCGWSLVPAAVLFAAFAGYQAVLARRGQEADCHCYGRLRRMRTGRPAAVGNGALAALALLAAAGGAGLPSAGAALPWRLGGGLVLAATYLAAMGQAQNPRTRFVFAEVRYLEERARGKSDREARAAVAEEFGLSFESSYLLLPRTRAAVILMRKRLGLKTTL